MAKNRIGAAWIMAKEYDLNGFLWNRQQKDVKNKTAKCALINILSFPFLFLRPNLEVFRITCIEMTKEMGIVAVPMGGVKYAGQTRG